MEKVAQNNFLNTPDTQNQPGGYYATVFALTPKESAPGTDVPLGVRDTPLTVLFSPLLIYGSVILFFALFLGAIIVQIISKSLDRRRTLASFIVAIVIATLPVTLKTALEVTSLQTRASPDEVPRNVTITRSTTRSIVVSWETQAEKTGSVRFDSAPGTTDADRVVIADGGRKTQKHTAKLENLEPGVEYELEILSGKQWYNDQGKPIKFKIGL